MNMPLLKLEEYMDIKQVEKIQEEFDEYTREEIGSDAELEELLDLITAIFTKLTHENSKEKLQKAMEKHTEKLQSRGWETKGTIKIKLEDEE